MNLDPNRSTTPHWGFGAGLTDFQAYFSSDPNFAGAWNDIAAQLAHEGADASQINLAKTALVDSFQQMASNLGVSGDQAIAAAKSYVLLGQTVAGAAESVTGLVQAAESGSFVAITQTFTGTLIGAAIAAGAISAGVGAAVVGAVGELLNILASAGFFGQPSTDTEISNCGFYPIKPSYMVGCVAVQPVDPIQQAPGAVTWRTFPQPGNNTNTMADPRYSGVVSRGVSYSDQLIWFTTRDQGGGGGLWKGARWDGPGTIDHPSPGNVRLVDLAFPNYSDVAYEAVAAGGFSQAYFGAWKANAEFALNGLKPQPDEQVLIHALRLWNRAHAGPTTPLYYDSRYPISRLIPAALSRLSGGDPLVSGQGLLLNTGALIQPQRVVTLHLPTNLVQSSAPPTSTAAKVAGGAAVVAGAGLLTAAVVGWASGKAIDKVFSAGWEKIKGVFR